MECLTYTASVKAVDGEPHKYRARLWQTTDADRHGDSIDVSEFQTENYLKNPIVLLHHKALLHKSV